MMRLFLSFGPQVLLCSFVGRIIGKRVDWMVASSLTWRRLIYVGVFVPAVGS